MKLKRRIRLTFGHADFDDFDRVQLGDRLVPRRIDVVFAATADRWPELRMTIEVISGLPQCTSLTVSAVPGGREVRSMDLKAVRIEEWIENIVAEAAVTSVAIQDDDGGTAYLVSPALSEEEFRESRKEVQYARQGSRRRVNDAMLSQVADIYRSHLDDRPVEAVQAAFGTSYRTASRYVQLARSKGLLPPTTPGKVQG